MRLPADDLQARASQILADIGEDPAFPNQPVVSAKIPPPSQIQPSIAERRSLPLKVAETMLRAGILTPDQLRLLQPIAIAPGFDVNPCRLYWHPVLQQLCYRSPNGNLAALDRVHTHLNLGGGCGEDALWSSSQDARSQTSGLLGCAEGSGTYGARYTRFAVPLRTTMLVYEQHLPAHGSPLVPDGHCQPTGRWLASTEYGEYRLVCLDHWAAVDATLPLTFDSADDAMAAADAAVLGEPCQRPPDMVDGIPNPYDPEHYLWVPASVPQHVIGAPGVPEIGI